ncbi:MAG: HNH endonuclease [Acidobacteria bacterium]|nr:HNH endonuclease [Acidobacteriota bacterium]
MIRRAKPLTHDEGMKILARDHFRCQYCGLDGTASFENALMMTVDFIIPRALKGKKDPRNLVAACRPCNLIKGRHHFHTFEEAKNYVLQHREAKRQEWEKNVAAVRSQKATA